MSVAKISEKLFDELARVGAIIHIPTMIAPDVESMETEVEDFLFDDLDEHLVARLDAAIPGLQRCVNSAWEEYESTKEREWYLSSVAEFLARRSPVDFIVKVSWQVRTCHVRGKRFPLGTFTAGWGHYANQWYAGKTIAACVRAGLADARAAARASWEKAPLQEAVRKRAAEEEE